MDRKRNLASVEHLLISVRAAGFQAIISDCLLVCGTENQSKFHLLGGNQPLSDFLDMVTLS